MITAATSFFGSNQSCVLSTPAQVCVPAERMPGISSSRRKNPKLYVRFVSGNGSQSAVTGGMAVTIFRKASPFMRSASIHRPRPPTAAACRRGPAIEEHAQEAHVVRRRRIERMAHAVEFRMASAAQYRKARICRPRRARRPRQPRLHGAGDLEIGVRHAERPKNFFAAELIDFPAVDFLDHLAEPVDADAVAPARARIGHHRIEQRGFHAGQDRRMPGHRQILRHVGVPELIFEAAGVGGELAHRRLALGRAQHRLVAVEAFEHLDLGEVGKDVFHGRVGIELAAVDQQHGGRAADGLGHREDAEHGIGGSRLAGRAFARGPRPFDARSCRRPWPPRTVRRPHARRRQALPAVSTLFPPGEVLFGFWRKPSWRIAWGRIALPAWRDNQPLAGFVALSLLSPARVRRPEALDVNQYR